MNGQSGSSLRFRLLEAFAATFQGRQYLHRNSQLGNRIADYLFDDLFVLSGDSAFHEDARSTEIVLNPKGVAPGVSSRRGDGSVGPLVPGHRPRLYAGHELLIGSTAEVDIGAEVKILAKAMIKQIDRVISDLCGQARQFRTKSPDAITIGIVGINTADNYISYEGSRAYPTGQYGPHPRQEALEAERRLRGVAEPCFDEFIVLPFAATNSSPYPFEWADLTSTQDRYSSMLLRISREYDRRRSRRSRHA